MIVRTNITPVIVTADHALSLTRMTSTRIETLNRSNSLYHDFNMRLREYLAEHHPNHPVCYDEDIQLAKAGKYMAQNYAQYEIDLAILLYELGGGGAVYAMNHSIFALPSRDTIQPYRQQFNLIPSIPSHLSNVAFDELATERRIDYVTETDEMGGFCMEHLAELETVKVGKGTCTVEAAFAAVKEGKVHIAQETCVGAIKRLYETNYGAKPVFIGPTCKKGPWQDSLRTMETVVEAWKRSPDGEAKHGPLVSIATDGEHKRRLALLVMCMQEEILPGNPLYPFFSKFIKGAEMSGLVRMTVLHRDSGRRSIYKFEA
ncbi:hypothetical protein B0H14DRAFT_2610775 [Mycena olivaceomarginata]|nr:hypothetical protein B0H14DRAFT_2610775 [Mycena olivaceomarginata]